MSVAHLPRVTTHVPTMTEVIPAPVTLDLSWMVTVSTVNVSGPLLKHLNMLDQLRSNLPAYDISFSQANGNRQLTCRMGASCKAVKLDQTWFGLYAVGLNGLAIINNIFTIVEFM